MKSKIKTSSINDVALLCEKAKEVDGDVIISKGKFAVDAKSILGCLSLDMADGVTIEYPDNADNFTAFLHNFFRKEDQE